MQKPELNLSDYWRIVRRRKLLIIASTLIIGLVVFSSNYTTPPLYQTSTTVMVEKGKSLTMGSMPSYSPYEGDFIDTQTTIIGSEPVAEEAAWFLGWVSKETPPEEYNQIVKGIMGGISAEKVRMTNLVSINDQPR